MAKQKEKEHQETHAPTIKTKTTTEPGQVARSTAAWIARVTQKKRKCFACRDEGNPKLKRLLTEINEAKAFTVSLKAIHEHMDELSPGYASRVGFDSMRHHLADHEPLWHRSRTKQS